MEPIDYRVMNSGEEAIVCDLVADVFNQFVASDYEKEGVEEFFRFANSDALKERIKSGGFVLVALQADTIVGMIEFFPPDCVAMLFVTLQHKGIAKTLLAETITKARASNPDLSRIIVHSSPFAETIYEKMGFEKTGDTVTENGITYITMELLLERSNA